MDDNSNNNPVGRKTCGSLLAELQGIWHEIGESDREREKMVVELEKDCLDVYKRKVEQASRSKARLHQQLAHSYAEFAKLLSALGERSLFNIDKQMGTLREQLAFIGPALEELRKKKETRIAEFMDVQRQIINIRGEIAGSLQLDDARGRAAAKVDERDLSLTRLDEFRLQHQELNKEKIYRLQKVLDYLNTIRDFATILAVDFIKLVTEVHPSLDDSMDNQSKSISNDTLSGLARTVQSLKEVKHQRLRKLQELGTTLIELWNLMDTPMEEQKLFDHVTRYISASVDESQGPGELALEIIEQAEIEVQRLDQLKMRKMKELILKKQKELEEIYKSVHAEVDGTSAQERLLDLINCGTTDLSGLLGSMDGQIAKAKEEALSRKEILDKVEKWKISCEEESWLEDYNRDQNRYNGGRGTHINLKRAEKARVLVNKIPSLVEILVAKIKAWEEERGIPFLYDGASLLSSLDDYIILRQEREEEKRRLKDQKRQELLATEQEKLFVSKPSPKPLSAKKTAGQRGIGTPSNQLLSVTPNRQALSASRDARREKSKSLPLYNNVVALSRNGSFSQVSETDSVVFTP